MASIKEQELIIKLRADTQKLNKDLGKAKRRLKRFQGNIGKIGKSIRGNLLAAFGGAAILQGLTTAVKSMAQFELVMDKVQATSGASSKQIESLTENALNLGRTTKFTAGQIGNLQLELSKLGFSTSKILATTAAVTKLAKVTDEDLGESAKTLAGTLNSFNLEASQSERIANLMAESFTKSALTLEKFTVGTANSGATATAWGVTAENNTARLAKLVDANIDASKAGTDLRKIYMELNTAGMTYDDALSMVAKSTNKLSTAQKLVGVRAAGALLILTQQKKAVNDLTSEFNDSNREIDSQAAIVSDNLVTSWALFNSAIDGVIQKATPLRKALKGITDDATKLINSLIPDDIKARDAAFQKFTKALNQFGDTKEGLNDVTVAYGNLEGKIAKAEKTLNDWVDLNTNINNEILPNASQSVGELEDEYEGLKNALAALVGEDNAYLARIEAITDALKAQAAAVKLLRDNAEINQQQIPFQGAKFEGVGAPETDITKGIEPLKGKDITAGITEGVKKNQEELKKIYDQMIEDHRFFAEAFQGVTSDVLVSAFDSLGDAIGGGGTSLKEAFGKIIGIMATNMQKIGAAMIAQGVSTELFKKSLESLNGFAAIAAGGAMVAAGAVLKAAQGGFSSAMAGGGSSGGGGGRFQGGSTGQSINVTGRFEVDGRSLVAVLNQQTRSDIRNIG